MTVKTDWTVADRISDAIVDVLNRELLAMRDDELDGNQLLVGQLLAFCALEKTMPSPSIRPVSLLQLQVAVRECLVEIGIINWKD